MTNPGDKTHHQSDAGLSVKDRFALRRLDFVIILIAGLLILGWVYHRGNGGWEGILERPLRVGIVAWPGYAGGLVANRGLRPNKDSIFWDKHHLLVEFVEEPDDAKLLRMFQNNEVDVIWRTVDTLALQAPEFEEKGIHPKAFMQVDWSRGGDAIVARAGLDKVEDLKGKRVAVPIATSQWLFEYSLKNSSLTDDDRKAIRDARKTTDSPEEALRMFVKDEVDAAVLWEPVVTEAIRGRNGAHVLLDTSDWPGMIADVMVAKEEFIKERHNVIVALIDGWTQGTAEAIKDPMLAVQYLRIEEQFDNLGIEGTHELVGTTACATLGDNAEMFGLEGGNAYFDILFDEASAIWRKEGYMKKDAIAVAAQDMRDADPLKEVYGIHRLWKATGSTCGAETPTQTIGLPMGFQPNSAELTENARTVLNNKEALFVPNNKFCIEAVPVDGDNPLTAREIARVREGAVIEYLRTHYDRSQSQFASANSAAPLNVNPEKRPRYVRLKLTAAGNQASCARCSGARAR
jgi:ABC-type nitrate/sulfonate/bicarbonate transport system substrate-binding protein